jgi:hypothetical protein
MTWFALKGLDALFGGAGDGFSKLLLSSLLP